MKIGFIGLGIMGKPMGKNILKAGFELVVCSRTQSSVDELVAAGATSAATPQELAAQVDLVITMLPNSPEVKEVILGPNGVIHGARPGCIVADMSSIAPLASQEIAASLAEKGIEMLDAPVSGGQPKAIEGTLSVMVGGKQEIFDRCVPVFKSMAASVVRVGNIGAGNVTKLANQVIVALNIAALSEAMVLAAKAGVEPELVYQAIRGGLAGSTVMDAKAPLMLDRKFNPGFKINLHIKDLKNALETSQDVGAPLPLTASVMEIMQGLKDDFGDSDHGALVRHFEKQANIELARSGGIPAA
jgi:2-hydroxy-3-oxopropionate reductase